MFDFTYRIMSGNRERRVSVYMRNKRYNPSDYYVVYQYLKAIKDENINTYNMCSNIEYHLYMKPFFRSGIGNWIRKPFLYMSILARATFLILYDYFIRKPEIIVINREIFPNIFPMHLAPIYEKLISKKKIVWCFDDRIDLGEISEFEWNMLCDKSEKILVTHEILMNILPYEARGKASFFPQSDGDFEYFSTCEDQKRRDNRSELYPELLKIIWVGTSSNLANIEDISTQLEEAAELLYKKEGKKIELTVVSNAPYTRQHRWLNVINIKWSKKKAILHMNEAHVGIMPLIDNEYNKGKGGFKLIQYLTSGIPVIASAVGYNSSIINDKVGMLITKEKHNRLWVDAIIKIGSDYENWGKMSEAACRYSRDNFAYNRGLDYWMTLLKE